MRGGWMEGVGGWRALVDGGRGGRAGLSRRPIFRVKRMVGREVLRE